MACELQVSSAVSMQEVLLHEAEHVWFFENSLDQPVLHQVWCRKTKAVQLSTVELSFRPCLKLCDEVANRKWDHLRFFKNVHCNWLHNFKDRLQQLFPLTKQDPLLLVITALIRHYRRWWTCDTNIVAGSAARIPQERLWIIWNQWWAIRASLFLKIAVLRVYFLHIMPLQIIEVNSLAFAFEHVVEALFGFNLLHKLLEPHAQ